MACTRHARGRLPGRLAAHENNQRARTWTSARRRIHSCTDETVLASALDACRTNMIKALDTIAANKKATAKVRIMALYYPGLADDRGRTCGSVSG